MALAIEPGSKRGGGFKEYFERALKAPRVEALLNEKRADIIKHIQRPDVYGEDFVTVASLRKVWGGELRKFVDTVGLGFDADDKKLLLIENRLLRTLSILVYIRWREWDKFAKVFMPDGDDTSSRSDNLPYQRHILREKTFLGKHWGQRFYENQNIFIPIVLRVGDTSIYERGRRLPLNTGEKVLGAGPYWTTKEIIPEGQLVFKYQGRANSEDYVVTRRVTTHSDPVADRQNLELLRDLREHRHIAMSIAAVSIGNQFNLFFDLARTDLGVFLHSLQRPVGLRNLLLEASNLLDALDFLHSIFDTETFYRVDLKPENVLVYERLENPKDIVGKWKIMDFSISKTNIFASSQRTLGMYAAPEIDATWLSDIWSFGCILHQILAAGLGGGSLIRHLDGERRKITDTDELGSHRSPIFYRLEENGTVRVLKSCVKRWMENDLPNYPHYFSDQTLAGRCSKLVLQMLQVRRLRRPGARIIKERLDDILAVSAIPGPIHSQPSGQATALQLRRPTASESVGGLAAPRRVRESTASKPDSRPVRRAFIPGLVRAPTATKPYSGPVKKPTISELARGPTSLPRLSPALIIAIKSTVVTAVYDRLARGDKILARDGEGCCALHHAVTVGHSGVLLHLLNSEELKYNKGGINQRDDFGATPLHYAASGAEKEIASELLKAGADKDAKDYHDRTPLHMSALGNSGDHTNFVEFLLDSGAKETPHLPPEFKVKKNFINFRKHKREKMGFR